MTLARFIKKTVDENDGYSCVDVYMRDVTGALVINAQPISNSCRLGSDVEFQPLNYRYAFSFNLPHQLPGSFEGAYGSLRYYIKATLGRRYMLDAVFKRGFSVNTIVDLNQNFQASVSTRETLKT